MADLHIPHLAHTKKCVGLVEVVVMIWEVHFGNDLNPCTLTHSLDLVDLHSDLFGRCGDSPSNIWGYKSFLGTRCNIDDFLCAHCFCSCQT